MADGITCGGLDLHKDGIVVAIADNGLRDECASTAGLRRRPRRSSSCAQTRPGWRAAAVLLGGWGHSGAPFRFP